MLWRIWTFLAGLPVGALGALALLGEPSAAAVQGGALLGGASLCAVLSLLARRAGGKRGLGWRLSRAASAGLVALPALGASLLGLRPGAPILLLAVLLLLAAAVLRVLGGSRPPGGPGAWLRAALLAPIAGAAAVVVLATLGAVLGGGEAENTETRSAYLYDLDARVVNRALPRCRDAPAAVELLAPDGAHPRLGGDDRFLWFDARGPAGRRQIQRLDLRTGKRVCWTCGEPGNNRRPAAGRSGLGVLFDTDRHRSWLQPANTEIHLIGARGDQPTTPSRRLTFSPGPDDHALYDPGERVAVWSRGAGGGQQVVTAALRTGHGGLLLGAPSRLASGGAVWTAPVAWAPDARSLVVARGSSRGPSRGREIDPATGETRELPDRLAGASAASFTADGGWMAVSTTGRHGGPPLPDALGFLLSRAAIALGAPISAPRDLPTTVSVGQSWGEARPLVLGEVGSWGEPTGLALFADGRSLVLGQRRVSASGSVEERLLRLSLDCEGEDAS